MESGEAESLSLSGLDAAGNPAPRPRDSSQCVRFQDIPVWEQQMMTFPITSPSKGYVLLPQQHDADSAVKVTRGHKGQCPG